MRCNKKECMWRRGSMTVETALLMPIVIMAWMGAVSICLFVYNRAWLTAAVYESAITGSWDAMCSEGDMESRAREKLQLLLKNALYGSKDIHSKVEENGNAIFVTVEGRHMAYGGLEWRFCVTGSRKLCSPVSFIRQSREFQGIGGS